MIYKKAYELKMMGLRPRLFRPLVNACLTSLNEVGIESIQFDLGVPWQRARSVLKRALAPFPAALDAFERDRSRLCQ